MLLFQQSLGDCMYLARPLSPSSMHVYVCGCGDSLLKTLISYGLHNKLQSDMHEIPCTQPLGTTGLLSIAATYSLIVLDNLCFLPFRLSIVHSILECKRMPLTACAPPMSLSSI